MLGLMVRSFCLTMHKTILIALAGLIGTLLRYWLAGVVSEKYGETFPWGTMAVNLIGCVGAGAVFFLTEERFVLSPTLRTVILIGLFGGFTTFSSSSLRTFALLRDGEFGFEGCRGLRSTAGKDEAARGALGAAAPAWLPSMR